MIMRFLQISLVCFFLTLGIAVRAKSALPVEHNINFLKYEDFRRLASADQAQYIEEMRHMVLRLSAVTQGSKEFSDLTSWTTFLNFVHAESWIVAILTPASAANADQCMVVQGGTSGNQYCLKCGVTKQQCVSGSGDDAAIAQQLVSQYNAAQAPGQKQVGASTEDVTKAVSDARYNQSSNSFNGNLVVVNGSSQILLTPASSEPIVIATPPGQALPAGVQGVAIETEKGQPTVIKRSDSLPNTESLQTNGTTKPDIEAKAENGPVLPARCIYAGFLIKGATCSPKSEVTLNDSHNKSKLFSCVKAAGTFKPNPKKTVLCNPLLFGSGAGDTPICVAASKTATSDCNKVSGTTQSAADLAKFNDGLYKDLSRTITQLCDANPATLKTTFPQMNTADIKSTCAIYNKKFSAYYNDLDASSSGASGKGHR